MDDQGNELVPVLEEMDKATNSWHRGKALISTCHRTDVGKWPREELEDRFYRLQDEHTVLKKHCHRMDEVNKRLTTKLRRTMSDSKPPTAGAASRRELEMIKIIRSQQEAIEGLENQLTANAKSRSAASRQSSAPAAARTGSASRRHPFIVNVRTSLRGRGGSSYHLRQSGSSHQQLQLPRSVDQLLGKARQEIVELQERASALTERNQQLEEAAAALQQHSSRTEQKLDMLKEQLHSKRQEYEEEVESLKSQLTMAGRTRLAGNVDIIKLQRELRQTSARLARLQNQSRSAEDALISAQSERQRLQQLNVELSTRVESSEARCDRLQREHSTSSAQTSDQLRRLELTVTDLQDENGLLRSTNEKLSLTGGSDADWLEQQRHLANVNETLRSQLVSMETALRAEQTRSSLLSSQLTAEQQRSWRLQSEALSAHGQLVSRSVVEALQCQSSVDVQTPLTPTPRSIDRHQDRQRTTDDVQWQLKDHPANPIPVELSDASRLKSNSSRLESPANDRGDSCEQRRRCDRPASTGGCIGDEDRPSSDSPTGQLFNKIDSGESLPKQLVSLHCQYVDTVQEFEKSQLLLSAQKQIESLLESEIDSLKRRLQEVGIISEQRQTQLTKSLDVCQQRIQQLEQMSAADEARLADTADSPHRPDSAAVESIAAPPRHLTSQYDVTDRKPRPPPRRRRVSPPQPRSRLPRPAAVAMRMRKPSSAAATPVARQRPLLKSGYLTYTESSGSESADGIEGVGDGRVEDGATRAPVDADSDVGDAAVEVGGDVEDEQQVMVPVSAPAPRLRMVQTSHQSGLTTSHQSGLTTSHQGGLTSESPARILRDDPSEEVCEETEGVEDDDVGGDTESMDSDHDPAVEPAAAVESAAVACSVVAVRTRLPNPPSLTLPVVGDRYGNPADDDSLSSDQEIEAMVQAEVRRSTAATRPDSGGGLGQLRVRAEVHRRSSALSAQSVPSNTGTDSEGVVVHRSLVTKSVECVGECVTIAVQWLCLNASADIYKQQTRPAVFVEYRFLDLPPEALESPVSLPLGPPDSVLMFNFNKAISVDRVQQPARRQLLAAMLAADGLDGDGGDDPSAAGDGGIMFTVVAEPPEESADNDSAECSDIGYAFVYLPDLVVSDVEWTADTELDVTSDEGDVIGRLAVSVGPLPLLRAVAARQ